MVFFGVFLRLVLCVCVCFYECEPSVRLQRVGVQGLLEKVCQQQRFYKCLLCIEINTLGLGGGWAWPMRAVFHNHLRFKNTVFFPHRGAALDCFCFTFPTRCIPMKKHTMWRDKGNDQCADIFLLKCWKEHEQVEISSVFLVKTKKSYPGFSWGPPLLCWCVRMLVCLFSKHE